MINIKPNDQSLVGKELTNSHYKEWGWVVKVKWVGECGFVGDESKKYNISGSATEAMSVDVPVERWYGFRQFGWEYDD